MLMMSFDDALTRANFSFVYFVQFYLLIFFDIFQWEGFEPPKPPSGYATAHHQRHVVGSPQLSYRKYNMADVRHLENWYNVIAGPTTVRFT